MSISDAGHLVTNDEVLAFVAPMNNNIGTLETVVIQSVEDMVEDYCQRTFEETTYTDEQYLIRRASVTFDQMIIAPRLEVRLRQRPVIEFTTLKQVTERSEVDGTPVNPQTVSRNLYNLDAESGILIFVAPVQSFSIGTFPLGIGTALTSGLVNNPYIELLATYSAGYEDIPKRLKLAVLMAIYRVYKMTLGQNWHRTETQTSGAVNIWESFIRQEGGFTPEEKAILNAFITPAAA